MIGEPKLIKDWINEARLCLDYALDKLQKEYRNVKINNVVKSKILRDYYEICCTFKYNYVKGYLDSFQKAACLMSAIHKNKILFYGDNQITDVFKVILQKSPEELDFVSGDYLKAQLALDAAIKMCENPICYVGENCDVKKQLEKFRLPQFINMFGEEWEVMKIDLLVTSHASEGKRSETVYKNLMLKYLYNYVNSKTQGLNDELTQEQIIEEKSLVKTIYKNKC